MLFSQVLTSQVVPANNQLEDAFAYQRQLSFIEPCLPFARGQATVRLQLDPREKHEGFSEPIALAPAYAQDFRQHGPRAYFTRRVSACKLLSKMRGLGGHGLSVCDVQGCAASKSLRLILRSTQNSALIQDTHSRAASEQIHLLNRASPVEA